MWNFQDLVVCLVKAEHERGAKVTLEPWKNTLWGSTCATQWNPTMSTVIIQADGSAEGSAAHNGGRWWIMAGAEGSRMESLARPAPLCSAPHGSWGGQRAAATVEKTEAFMISQIQLSPLSRSDTSEAEKEGQHNRFSAWGKNTNSSGKIQMFKE